MPSLIKYSAAERLQSYTFVLLAIGTAAIFLLLAKSIISIYTNPLSKIPGPALARYTRLWLLREYYTGKHHLNNIELHERYGPIVRIAPNQYSISDPTAIKTLYGHGSHFRKSSWYTPWGLPEFSNMFNVIDIHAHGIMRRKLSHAYSMSSLVSYEPYVNECIALFEQQLSNAATQQITMDMFKWLRCYAFDVIGMITFSHRLGFLDRGQDEAGFIKGLDASAPLSACMGLFPNLWPMFTGFGRLVGLDGPAGLKAIDNYVLDRINDVKQRGPVNSQDEPMDFIQKLVATQLAKSDACGLLDGDIRIAANSNMVAGSDTTGISLTVVIYHLIKNPIVMAKLQDEIDQAVLDGRVSDPITFKESQELPYLQAVIREALRVHPATGYTMPRVVPQGGAVISGQFFPAGTVIGVNSWVAHANTEIWGSDARVFNPDRWFKEGSTPSDIYYLTFGQGARTCIGKNISLLEINKLIPQLVRHFNFQFDTMDRELEVKTHWFTYPQGLPCQIFRRSPRERST